MPAPRDSDGLPLHAGAPSFSGATAPSLRESFDVEGNPAVRRLLGIGLGARRKGMPLIQQLLCLLPFVLTALWLAGITGAWETFTGNVASLTYVMWVIIGFGAPAFGAAIRRSFDRDPFLQELLTTGLTERQVVAGLQGAVLMLAGSAAATVLLPGAGLLAALLIDDTMNPPPYSLWLLFLLMGYGGYPPLTAEPLVLAGAALFLVGASASFGAGIYLHSTLLARLCQIDPRTKFQGGLLTAAIGVALPLFLLLRLFLPLRGLVLLGAGSAGLFFAAAAIELVTAAVRFGIGRRLFARMPGRVLDITRASLMER
jgi:hypothetical protein